MQRKIAASGATVLELVVLRDSSRGKVQVHDPRRVRQGTLTSALTWGVFGWLAGGGWSGLAIWAVIGAVCGGLYAYYTEHVLTKGQLARIATAATTELFGVGRLRRRRPLSPQADHRDGRFQGKPHQRGQR